MAEQERMRLGAAEQYMLEIRAAHVYLDAASSLKDVARRQVNIDRARETLASLDRALLEAPIDDPLRPLRDRLAERLDGFD